MDKAHIDDFVMLHTFVMQPSVSHGPVFPGFQHIIFFLGVRHNHELRLLKIKGIFCFIRDKMSNYRSAFHSELKSFLKNLCATFEDDRELLMITSSLHFALMDDPDNKVIKQFKEAIDPFKGMVETRDSQFFYQAHNYGTEYKLFSKLNVYWESLSQEDQKTVWDYLQLLYKLAWKLT